LRANHVDEYRPDSEGDIYLNLYTQWVHWTTDEAAKQNVKEFPAIDDRWQAFADQKLGAHCKNAKRYLQLLGNPTWSKLAEQWCKHNCGRATFKAHHFTDAIGLYMDSVSCDTPRACQGLFGQRLTSIQYWKKIFTNALQKLDSTLSRFGSILGPEDLTQLTRVGNAKAQPQSLRRLFFPMKEDGKASPNPVKMEWFLGIGEYA
jgi:hypothetical protein